MVGFVPVLVGATWSCGAGAQEPAPPAPTGAPPAEAKALVEAPKAPGEEPDVARPLGGTTITISAGGQLATGNSRLLAGTVNGAYESRIGDNGVGASVLGNYGQGAPPGQPVQATAENIQGRLRYDRYVIDQASVFLIGTARHDRFQGLDLRLNVDPGVKYLFLKAATNALWGELGYDFQYDIRRSDALAVVDASGAPVLDANGNPEFLSRTATDHSARAFVGLRHAFNKEVTLATGLEYLQSVVDSTRYRVNFDGVFAAKVGGGLAVGLGFSARYDHAPLPTKEQLDTATTVSLIYAFSDVPEPKPAGCP
jgi:putative salt-induced outer membrane protein